MYSAVAREESRRKIVGVDRVAWSRGVCEGMGGWMKKKKKIS